MHLRAMLAACSLLLTHPAAFAACDMPSIAPADVLTVPGGGATLHIVTGVTAFCDPALRSFDVVLPELHGIRSARVQLSLVGFTRHYGVHQISFVLQSATAAPDTHGLKVDYAATVDGLDRYQLAYTLYVTTAP